MNAPPRSTFALALIAACGFVGAAGAAPADDLARMEAFYARFRRDRPAQGFAAGPTVASSLRELRKPRISRADWERLAAAGATAEPEAAFRMARHALLLELPVDDIRAWAARVPADAREPWYASARYVLGLVGLRAKDFDAAAAEFSAGAAQAPKGSAIARLSTLALARIAYARADYGRAEELYSSIVSRPSFDETVLHELSWTHFAQGDVELAYTDLYLLFSLYPESDELFQTSSLLSRIYEKRAALDAGTDTLEKLALRFAVESENTERAFRAFAGHEDELLYELDPSLEYRPARALLPTLARSVLAADKTVRARLAELGDLYDARADLDVGDALVARSIAAWRKNPAVSLDSMTLLAWANDAEADWLGLPPEPESVEIAGLRAWTQEVSVRIDELGRVTDGLLAVDRYLSAQWMSLGGERAALTLLAKQDLRRQIQSAAGGLRRARRLKLDLEFAALERKFARAREVADRLKARRGSPPPEIAAALARLDALRASTVETARAQNAADLARAKEESERLRRERAALEAALRDFGARARGEIRAVLPAIRERIAGNLNEYRWSIAEGRYKLFKAFDARTRAIREQGNLESARRSERYDAARDGLPSTRPPVPSADADFLAFQAAAREAIQEARATVEAGARAAEEKDAPFREKRESAWSASANDLRGKAILAFEQYAREGVDPRKTPYALFRLAQLRVDRAKEDPDAFDAAAAIAALERVRREFPDFPYQDRASYLLASIYAKEARFGDSDPILGEIARRFPDSPVIPDVELRLGEARFNERRFAEARPHYQRALERGDAALGAKARYKIAWCHYLEKDYAAAISAFAELLERAESPDPKVRATYGLFAPESAEYIAFGLYRADENQNAGDLVRRLGDKPYAERVLAKTAAIFEDRGRHAGADQVYAALIARFPLSPDAPAYFEKRVSLAARGGEETRVRDAKVAAIAALSAGGAWRNANAGRPETQRRADDLIAAWLYDVAVSYERAPAGRAQALAYYQRIVDANPESREAYDAIFRIAEISFGERDLARAAVNYDLVVRSGKHGHHFSAALYNIVAVREAELAGRGGLETLIKKDRPLAEGSADAVLFAVDNFTDRLPDHPEAAKASFRAAEIERILGRTDRAAERYAGVWAKHPNSSWNEAARLAEAQLYVDAEDWPEAARRAGRSLAEERRLSPAGKARLGEIKTASSFAAAADLDQRGKPKEALDAFLAFEREHPDGPLASKAVFNAVLIARKAGDPNAESRALALLLTKYENSPEAKAAHLERAYFLDATYDVDEAAAEYRVALRDQGLNAEQKRAANLALAELIAVSPAYPDAPAAMVELARTAREPASTEILAAAADLAAEQGKPGRSAQILAQVAKSGGAPRQRALAHARLSRFAWQQRDAKEGQRRLGQSLDALRRLPAEDSALVAPEVGEAYLAKAAFYRDDVAGSRLAASTPEALSKSFQRKAAAMNLQEKAAIETLKYPAPAAQVAALSDLDRNYRAFSKEMLEIDLPAGIPAGERAKFRATMKGMSDPLLAKADQASAKAREIMASARVSDESLSPLGRKATNRPVWPGPYLPEIPEPMGYDREQTYAVTEKAVEALGKGNEALRRYWNREHRDIALQFFGAALAEVPNYPPALYGMALVRLVGESASDVRRLISLLQRTVPESRWKPLLATHQYLRGHWGDAYALAGEILEKEPASRAMASLAILSLLAQKKGADAVARARAWVKNQPREPLAHRLLAKAYQAAGNPRMAKFVARRALRSFPEDGRAKSEYAAALTAAHDRLLQAAWIEEAAADGHPENAARWHKLQFDAGNTALAVAGMKEAIDDGGAFHPEIVYDYKLFVEATGGAP